jgi:glycosyltransferase involved in cell wall biosynthesis
LPHDNSLTDKKKIVHIGNYNPYEVDGGIEVATYNICNILGQQGLNVELLCCSLHNDSIIQKKYFKIINLNYSKKLFELPIISPIAIIKMFNEIKSADIVHIHYPNPATTLIASFFAKLLNKKYVVTIHTHIGIDDSSINRGILYKPLSYINNKLFLNFALINAQKILTPSPFFLKKSRYTNRFDNKSYIVPNGVDIDLFNLDIDPEIVRTKLNITDKMILFLGSLNSSHKGKGLLILLDAFKKVVEKSSYKVKLVIVGEGDLKQFYMNYAKDIGVDNTVIFTGRVLSEDLPKYYAAADVFVLPSTWNESFGIVLIEAMACGTPVIGSDIGGIPFVIGNAGILIPPNDPNILYNELNNILINENLAIQIGNNCRKQVEENFRWDLSVQKIINIYIEII